MEGYNFFKLTKNEVEMERVKLISFDLCPFVQRSIIVLIEKNIDFDIEYIDLENRPDWFLKISPLKKVPVLLVGNEALFESSVINEYLDEVYPKELLPKDPLLKAKSRSWIEYGNHLLMSQYKWIMSKKEESFVENQKSYLLAFDHIERALGEGPFFNGIDFSLVDAAYAPLWLRHLLAEEKFKLKLTNNYPKIKKWSMALSNRESIKRAMPDEFIPRYLKYLKDKEIYINTLGI